MRAVPTALSVATMVSRLRQARAVEFFRDTFAAEVKAVARFMSVTMNRTPLSRVGTTLAVIAILSCSKNSVTGTESLTSDNLATDANRIASVTVSLGSSTVAVGDTTRATAALRDYFHRLIYRSVTWSSSDPGIASVDSSGLVTGVSAGSAVITAARGYKSGRATITV